MSTRRLISAADPARALPPESFGLDVDAMLRELTVQPAAVPSRGAQPASRLRRRRLDLALAAVVAAFLVAVAFLPGSLHHGDTAGHDSGSTTPPTSAAAARAAANALLDGITVPAAAMRVAAPPAGYLSRPWTGLACKGTVSAEPRYWLVPRTTLRAVAQYLRAHRPAGASRLPFNHDPDTGAVDAFTSYRPSARSQVVIALATTPDGVGVRADADVAPGSTCVMP